MSYKLLDDFNKLESFIKESKVISNVLRNIIVATFVIVILNMLTFYYIDSKFKSFFISILLTGAYLVIHHMSYKNFYKQALTGGTDNSKIIGNDVDMNPSDK
jgi:hypothetical protein